MFWCRGRVDGASARANAKRVASALAQEFRKLALGLQQLGFGGPLYHFVPHRLYCAPLAGRGESHRLRSQLTIAQLRHTTVINTHSRTVFDQSPIAFEHTRQKSLNDSKA